MVTLVATELILRVSVPPARGYFTLVPGTDWTLTPAPDLIRGVMGVSHFRVNDRGIRGRPFGDDRAEYRVLAVGGSTTQCVALDDSEVWSHLLETGLERTADGRQVWVGNVGRDGATARDGVLHLKYLLPQYPRLDVVVALVGVNDMQHALQEGWNYRPPAPVTEPEAEAAQRWRAFALTPGRIQDPVLGRAGHLPWYKATAIWQLARRVKAMRGKHRTFSLQRIGEGVLQEGRRNRYTARTWIDSLPPLEQALVEYRRNLNLMADLAATAQIRLVFVTQPSVWRDNMSVADERLLWLGWLRAAPGPGRTYFTSRALRRAMDRYNDAVLEVCRERRLDCVDAAGLLPHDTTAMYDDVHFNEHGSRLLAQVLVEYFRGHPPLRGPT